jgi:hypothetical protein
MNFYYDPILGLQYDYLGGIIIFDIAQIPKDFDVLQYIEEWKNSYELCWYSGINCYPQLEVIPNITNYKL